MITLKNINLDQVIDACKRLGYPVFEKGSYNINTIGIRSDNRRGGKFDDALCVFYRINRQWEFFVYKATTDPGLTYLQQPMNPAGCAIMVPGFYPGAYQLSRHKGLPALRQCGVLRVYRDNNKDAILDMDPATIQAGTDQFCNIHYSKGDGEIETVGPFSAGCQVLAYGHKSPRYKHFLSHYELAIRYFPNRFSYGLLEEKNLDPYIGPQLMSPFRTIKR